MKDIVAKTGEYTNREGQTKAEWTKIGVILSNDSGEYILLDPSVNLAGVLTKQNMLAVEQKKAGNDKAKPRNSVMCSVFDKSENEGKSGPAPESNGGGSLDDDIPF
jgi:hypothetical protein